MSRRYLVKNISNEMQHFEGHALAAVRGGREGGSIWLSEETFLASAQPRIDQGEMELIRVHPPVKKEPAEEVVVDIETVVEPQLEEEQEPAEDIQLAEDEDLSEEAQESPDYASWKTSELRNLLKERGLYDASVRKKVDMISLLEAYDED